MPAGLQAPTAPFSQPAMGSGQVRKGSNGNAVVDGPGHASSGARPGALVGGLRSTPPRPPRRPILAVDQVGHVARVAAFDFALDGQQLFTLSQDNTIQVWDAAGREHQRTLRLPWKPGPGGKLVGYVQTYSTLAAAPDGKTLAVTLSSVPSAGSSLVARDRHTYELFLVHLESGQVKRLPGFSKGQDLGQLTFSRDG